MAVRRVLLTLSVVDLPLTDVAGIDASGFERGHASLRYTKRTNLTIQQSKTTLPVDAAADATLDIHAATRGNETLVAPRVSRRNADSAGVLTGDDGYDDRMIRQPARDYGARPRIEHREFISLHNARDMRLDGRSITERVTAAIEQRSGAFVQSRVRWKQFRELVIGCVVHDVERAFVIVAFGRFYSIVFVSRCYRQ